MAEDSNTNTSIFQGKDWLSIAKEYAWTIFKFSPLIVVFAIVLGKLMRERKMNSPTVYTANYSFKVNQEASRKQQDIASLFGGANAGGGSNVNFKRLQELILTRQVLARVMFDTISLRKSKPVKADLLINHYLDLFYYVDQTPEKAKKNYYFATDTIDPFNERANHLIRYVHNQIIRNHLILEPSPAGIMNIKVTSSSEDFSYELVHSLYRALNKFYNEEATRQTQIFYEMAKDRASQLLGQLRQAERAYITYANTHSAEARGRNNTLIETQFLSTDLKRATQSYFSALANMESAKVAYDKQRETPSITAVDPPLYPLPKLVPNPFLHMIAGGIVGAGLAFFLIVGGKFFWDLRQNRRLNTSTN